MYCDACGVNIPTAYKTCPRCGEVFGVKRVNNVSRVASVAAVESIEDIKRRSFIPAPYDEDIVPSNRRVNCTQMEFDLGFHYLLTKLIIWIWAIVNFVFGIVFYNGIVSFVESSKAFVEFKHISGLNMNIIFHGIEEAQQRGMIICVDLFGAALLVASLVILLSLIPLAARKEGSSDGFISALEFLICVKILSGVVASAFTQVSLFLCFTLLLAVLDIALMIVVVEYYKKRKHLFN